MTRAIGRSLELYYIDGRPDGMLTAELFNWTGHVLMVPRTQIAEALARPEASYAGVYLLIGEQEGEPRAYVGEGEDISARIRSHDVHKDWWTSAVLITASANKLNKAHVRYLEARLIAQARGIGRVPLDNGTNPTPTTLSEADVAKMEAFLDNLFIVLPAVRVDMFIQRTRPIPALTLVEPRPHSGDASNRSEETFTLQLKREKFKADAVLNADGEFVVLAGSQARPLQGPSPYAEMTRELLRAGVIAENADGYHFTQNYAFKSPSAAASVALGRSSNGTTAWCRMADGQTYKRWEAMKLGAKPNLSEGSN